MGHRLEGWGRTLLLTQDGFEPYSVAFRYLRCLAFFRCAWGAWLFTFYLLPSPIEPPWTSIVVWWNRRRTPSSLSKTIASYLRIRRPPRYREEPAPMIWSARRSANCLVPIIMKSFDSASRNGGRARR